MSTDYNVRVEFDTRDPIDGELLDALAAYSPVTARAATGNVEAILTIPAADFVQACQTTIALTAQAVRTPVLAIEIMRTEEFDRRVGLEPMPELVSVSEAARILGVSRQAILQRIDSGSLPASRIGAAWVLQRPAVEQLRAGQHRPLEQADVDEIVAAKAARRK